MINAQQLALKDAAEWLGDWHPLAEQLGSASGLVTLATVTGVLRIEPVRDLRSLRRFLRGYHDGVLIPVELPVIRAAFDHAARNELRELVDLDRHLLATWPMLGEFAAPSRRVGRCGLRRLRPLRDDRRVQRYLQAVQTGAAEGWHTLVYGLTLAVYSLPLRQGLLGYAHQTTRGFIYAAAGALRLSEHDCRRLFDEQCAGLPAGVGRLLQPE